VRSSITQFDEIVVGIACSIYINLYLNLCEAIYLRRWVHHGPGKVFISIITMFCMYEEHVAGPNPLANLAILFQMFTICPIDTIPLLPKLTTCGQPANNANLRLQSQGSRDCHDEFMQPI
jgi:hypothetical protein